jgi:translocation and assembly module TamB
MARRVRVDDDIADARDTKPRSVLSRLLRWTGLFVALLLILVAAAPWIINQTSLVQLTIDSSLALNGRVVPKSVSLSWFSNLSASEVTIENADGKSIATVAHLEGDRSLWNLLWDSSNFGTWTLKEPKILCDIYHDGSNIEDLIRPLLDGPASESTATYQFGIRVVDGTIDLQQNATSKQWQLEKIGIDSVFLVGQKFSLQMQIDSDIKEQMDGHLTVNLALGGETEQPSQAKIQCLSLPLTVITPIFQRLGMDLALNGFAEGGVDYQWDDDGAAHRISLTEFKVTHLDARSAELFGNDHVHLNRFESNGVATILGNNANFEKLAINCDLGTATAHGKWDFSNLTPDKLDEILKQSGSSLRGEIDLAALAAMFPKTLRVRNDTTITAGRVGFQLEGQPTETLPVWTAAITTSEIVADRGGKPIRWERPIAVNISAFSSDKGPVFQQIRCESDFITMNGTGTAEQGSITLNGDLDALVQNLRDLVDIDQYQLQGKLGGTVNWGFSNAGQTTASTKLEVQQFVLSGPGIKPWQETKLMVTAATAGDFFAEKRRVDHASAEIRSGNDVLSAELTKPVDDFETAAASFQFTFVGDLSTWQSRLQAITSFGDLQFNGIVRAAGTAAVDNGNVAFSTSEVTFESLAIQNSSMNIQEPEANVTLVGTWNNQSQTLKLTNALLVGSTVAARADGLTVSAGEKFSAVGRCDFQANAQRLGDWFLAGPEQTYQLVGIVTGAVTLNGGADQIQAGWDVTAADFAVSQKILSGQNGNIFPVNQPSVNQPSLNQPSLNQPSTFRPIWNEKELKLRGSGSYDSTVDKLTINSTEVISSAVTLSTQGSVTELTKSCTMDLRGNIGFGWEQVTQLLQSQLGPSVRIAGQDRQEYAINGPLFIATANTNGTSAQNASPIPTQFAATTSIGWQQVDAFGFVAGPTTVTAQTKDGNIAFNPIQVAISGGQLQTQPLIYLQTNKPTLLVGKGPLLTNVQITPQMCDGWLKFVAPLMAQTTRASGSFSVEMSDTAAVPFANVQATSAAGVVKIHAAKVGPGPLSAEFLTLATEIRALLNGQIYQEQATTDDGTTWIDIPEQQIPFHVANGRVYHNSLVMKTKDIVIRTQGWVGMDQTMKMVAEVPIADEWVTGKQYLSALKGQTLKIPIEGTLSRPKLDRSGLRDLSKRLLRDTANRFLQDQLNDGLKKILGQ